MLNVDMSPTAVTLRLKRVAQLRRLCLELGRMKPLTDEDRNTESIDHDMRSNAEAQDRGDISDEPRP